MRKHEFQSSDPIQITEILSETRIGRVGIITPDGYPRVVPVNFVWLKDKIYFHSAREGEKFDAFEANTKVSFAAEIIYSNIPSYWLGKESGCSASVLYKSVFMRGTGSVVADRGEKIEVLQALMEKEQPEGRYRRFTADEPLYRKAVDEVAICRIDPTRVDLKLKLGQNQSERVRLLLIDKLLERGTPLDIKTADKVRQTLSK